MYKCEYFGVYTWSVHILSETYDHPVIFLIVILRTKIDEQ